MSQQIQYIFFDWNGTLQQQGDHTKEDKLNSRSMQLYKAYLHRFGHVDVTEFCEFITETKLRGDPSVFLSNAQLVEKVLAKWNISAHPEEAKDMVTVFCEVEVKSPLFPAARATLEALTRRGVRLGLIRNSKMPEASMRKRLAKFGLEKYFEVVVMSGDVGCEKPDPRIFQAALEKARLHHIEPSRIAFVGNETDVDIRGANALGWQSVLVCHTEDHSSGLATHDLPSIEHVLHLVPGDARTILRQEDHLW